MRETRLGACMRGKPILTVTLKDCVVETMRSSKGAGGQHRDKTSSAIRVRHLPSGAMGKSQEYREQHRNKKLAFKRMVETPKFQLWCRMVTTDMGERVEKAVEAEMAKLKCEVYEEGEWVMLEDVE